MLTQIFIKPQDSGCQPEFTKIASQSFIFEPSGFFPGPILQKQALFTGGDVSILDYTYPIWSADVRNYQATYAAGNITDVIDASIAAMGIPLPINLVSNDTVTISGNASFNNASTYIGSGYEVSLILGVYYFNCSEVSAEGARVFTFIPVSTTQFDLDGKACFNADVTLGSNFDFHDTRILVGYNISATCTTEECLQPFVDLNVATVSYTLDIQRPCKAEIDNFIIRNCCVPVITELVHIPGLVVGDFHVDDEGNCWEVIDTSTDVTNFTRNFVDIYTSCVECQAANPCPLNLKISSCCVPGQEFVTGSLPGLAVGDTFVDNYGLCWTVEDETSTPISEESITVASIIPGVCEDCTTENPCPYFYYVLSCFTNVSGIIALPDLLSVGDAFVDTNGICWVVDKDNQNQLPTMYGIVVDTVYTGAVEPDTNCDLCIAANPCPTEYFITIKNCCDNDRVEVAQVPAAFMLFTEGTIFQDIWGICWEVISFNTTGVETYIIADWTTKPSLGTFSSCQLCRSKRGAPCGLYEVRECGSETTFIASLDFTPTIGLFYVLNNLFTVESSCYEIIGYGYPVLGELYPTLRNSGVNPTTNCEDCNLVNNTTTKTLEFSQCCPGAPNIIVEYTGLWNAGIGGTALIGITLIPGTQQTATCVTLIGYSIGIPTAYSIGSYQSTYNDCLDCLTQVQCNIK